MECVATPVSAVLPPAAVDIPQISDPEESGDSDVYRGNRRPRSPSSASTTSSSLSGSVHRSGPLGAIAAVLETAIARWARRRSSSPNSSSSSTRSSIITASRSQKTHRRKRRTSTLNLSQQSEREISARIKAREESQQIPREFVLYLPPSLGPTPPSSRETTLVEGQSRGHSNRVLHTCDLVSILGHLDTALRKSMRARRAQDRGRAQKHHPQISSQPSTHQDYMLPYPIGAPSRPASFTDLPTLRKAKKGKQKESISNPNSDTGGVVKYNEIDESNATQKAWWLDVACPNWEDMRAIGQLLHLHPLTLEDIIYQDPREKLSKLEIFPKLGYSLIVFRAIESRATRERFRRFTNNTSRDGDYGEVHDEGVIGEANVYLVVFREGICSFHFTDTSEHTDRLRDKVVSLEDLIPMSSDWIAHGILDSVVDAFFPFVEEIEKEVEIVENIVFADTLINPAIAEHIHPLKEADQNQVNLEKVRIDDNSSNDEKQIHASENSAVKKMHFSLPHSTLQLFRRFKQFLLTFSPLINRVDLFAEPPALTTALTLRRMARTRRLVTSLTRLLQTKSEVVTQIRKRLMTSNFSSRTAKNEELDVVIYMGDVHDHIITLQHALAHYEHMLSQSHPTYLSQLRTTASGTKSGTDKAVMSLSIISMGVLSIQTLIGAFSLNVTIPANGLTPGYPYNMFGVIISIAFLIICTYALVVRSWWINAKRRRSTVL